MEILGGGYSACLLRGKLEFKDIDLLVLITEKKKKKTDKASLKKIDGYFFGLKFASSDLGLEGNYRS